MPATQGERGVLGARKRFLTYSRREENRLSVENFNFGFCGVSKREDHHTGKVHDICWFFNGVCNVSEETHF